MEEAAKRRWPWILWRAFVVATGIIWMPLFLITTLLLYMLYVTCQIVELPIRYVLTGVWKNITFED